MKNIPLIDLSGQYEQIKNEVHSAMHRVLESSHYILGPEVKEFEHEIANYCGVRFAVGVGNGTDALLLALDARGIGPGDEVITTPFTFFATAEVISQLGATPVFVDIDPQTYNIDVDQIRAKINPNTKAVIPVHIFGQPANMDEIMELANEHNLFVLEDAAQALGATYHNKAIGSLGHAATFSFYPTKNLGAYGDGGMIVTNDEQLVQKIRIMRTHGSFPRKYYHNMLGYNSRLDELQAAILRIKLKYLDEWNNKRIERASWYNNMLKDLPIETPVLASARKHIYHLYIVQAAERDGLMAFLKQKGISTGVYYPLPLHLQEVYLHLGYEEGSLPYAESMAKRTFALPLFPELTHEQMHNIVASIEEYYHKHQL